MIIEPCNNCGTVEWGAKNDQYCTLCEREWWAALAMTIITHGPANPRQQYVDSILRSYGI